MQRGELADHEMQKEKSDDDKELLLLVAQVGDELVGFGRACYFKPNQDAPTYTAPEGWYLLGLIISSSFRRRGIARLLTEKRIQWLRERTDMIYYFVNKRNRVSIELHQTLGFKEITRDFVFPNALEERGRGILFRLDIKD